VDASGSKEKPNIVLDQLIMVTRPTGGLGIPGLYVPADPGAPDEQSKKGQILISFGKLFEKVCLSVSCGWMPIVNNVRDCTSVLGSAM
jgi:hypothetical protein